MNHERLDEIDLLRLICFSITAIIFLAVMLLYFLFLESGQRKEAGGTFFIKGVAIAWMGSLFFLLGDRER